VSTQEFFALHRELLKPPTMRLCLKLGPRRRFERYDPIKNRRTLRRGRLVTLSSGCRATNNSPVQRKSV